MKNVLFGFILLMQIPCFSQITANQIADSVIHYCGGIENWNDSRLIEWNFFGRRQLWWDKFTGDVRIEIPQRNLILLSNIHSRQGHVYRNRIELTDSNEFYMNRAYRIWVNDSYWLVFPFKLNDEGVTISRLPDGQDSLGNSCYLLQLTFENVGVTPQNKYHIFVDKENWRITWWLYFRHFTDSVPELSNAFSDYEKYGSIWLSTGRGVEGSLAPVKVSDSLPPGLFTRP